MKITNVLSNFHAGELVGWVDGNPYYGPHVLHDRKMVGEACKNCTCIHIRYQGRKSTKPKCRSATVSTTPTQQLASTTSSNTSSTTTSTGAASGGTSGGVHQKLQWRRRWIRVLKVKMSQGRYVAAVEQQILRKG